MLAARVKEGTPLGKDTLVAGPGPPFTFDPQIWLACIELEARSLRWTVHEHGPFKVLILKIWKACHVGPHLLHARLGSIYPRQRNVMIPILSAPVAGDQSPREDGGGRLSRAGYESWDEAKVGRPQSFGPSF